MKKGFKGFLMAFLILFSLFVVVNFTGNIASATNTYKVTFTETGLPTGTKWFVNLSNGQSLSSTNNTVIFNEPNGTYSYTIATADQKYAPEIPSAEFTVNGTNVDIPITFNRVYVIAVNETGLPSYIIYYFNVTNPQTKQMIYSAQIIDNFTFTEPNGTYNYTVTSTNKDYSPIPSAGTFTVNGANVNIPITFKLITYKVTFIENGLPLGMKWYLNMSNEQSFIVTGNFTFSETNGTYSYTIASGNKDYAPSPSMGTFTVNGANVNIAITFKLVTYKVTFIENGLPLGTKWYTNLSNGELASSNESLISFNIPNGTYNYTIFNTNNNYKPISLNGIFTVNGKNLTINLTFTKITNTTNSTTTGSGFINLPDTSITILDITIFFIILVIVLLILASIYKETKSKRRR